jgi:hypothetical protein
MKIRRAPHFAQDVEKPDKTLSKEAEKIRKTRNLAQKSIQRSAALAEGFSGIP